MTFAFDTTITLGVVVTVLIAIVGWVRMGRKAVDDAVAALDARIDRYGNRLATVEQTLTGMPGKDHIHELRLELAGMSGELREMRAVMQGNNAIMGRLETIVSRHEDHLLEGRK